MSALHKSVVWMREICNKSPLRTHSLALTSFNTVAVQIFCEKGVCLEEYKVLKALGRFVLREGGRTEAVGVVTEILSTR